MKEIKLTQGKVALVDDEDFEYLNQWKWYANRKTNSTTWYAKRDYQRHNIRYRVSMHREILKIGQFKENPNIIGDHKNINGLDNRKENLRVSTRNQNKQNAEGKRIRQSKYKGVFFSKKSNKWVAKIKKEDKSFWLGSFESEELAGRAYDSKAKELFGEFAYLNFPNE